MPRISELVVPHILPAWRDSVAFFSVIAPSLISAETSLEMSSASSPFLPLIDNFLPLSFASTPAGIWIGCFAMRDMTSSTLSLEYPAQHFAAHVLAARFLVGE